MYPNPKEKGYQKVLFHDERYLTERDMNINRDVTEEQLHLMYNALMGSGVKALLSNKNPIIAGVSETTIDNLVVSINSGMTTVDDISISPIATTNIYLHYRDVELVKNETIFKNGKISVAGADYTGITLNIEELENDIMYDPMVYEQDVTTTRLQRQYTVSLDSELEGFESVILLSKNQDKYELALETYKMNLSEQWFVFNNETEAYVAGYLKTGDRVVVWNYKSGGFSFGTVGNSGDLLLANGLYLNVSLQFEKDIKALQSEKLDIANVINDLITGGIKNALSAEQGKVLLAMIKALESGGTIRLLRSAGVLGDYDYVGELSAGGVDISVGTTLFNPKVFLGGVRISPSDYSVDLNLGTIKMNYAYSPEESVLYYIEDVVPNHVSFCFPTMDLLKNSTLIDRIKLDDVIKILGESEADDGGHYLVKCENVAKINAVDIGGGRFLNEVPNTNSDYLEAVWGGSNDEVKYVQQSGTKYFNKMYIDKISKKAYRCIANPSTTSTDLVANLFEDCSVTSNLDKLNNLISYSKVWQLQAFFGSFFTQGTFYPTSIHQKAIAIPISYKEIQCRHSFTVMSSRVANIEEAKLEELTIGQKLMSESFLVYEGKDSQFYYFHIETSDSWVDNNGFIYAR